MNDPFAMLDPIAKSKPAAQSAPPFISPPVAQYAPTASTRPGAHFQAPGGYGVGSFGVPPPAPTGGMMNSGMSMPMPMPMQTNGNQSRGSGTNMGMGMGMGMSVGMSANGSSGNGWGLQGMGMPSMNGFGGNMPRSGPGMAAGTQAQPVLYDNIKNLLQQQTVKSVSGPFADDSSVDFLENLGSPKANSISMTSPTAAGPVPSTSGGITSGLGVVVNGSAPTSATDASPSSGRKSSALADRLATTRRKTQESQRQQLALNANAFSQSAQSPRISFREPASAPASGSEASESALADRAPSLDDFASGKPVFNGGDASANCFDTASGGSGNGSDQRPNPNPPTRAVPTRSGNGVNATNHDFVVPGDSDADFDKKLYGAPTTATPSASSSTDIFW